MSTQTVTVLSFQFESDALKLKDLLDESENDIKYVTIGFNTTSCFWDISWIQI